MFLLWITCYKRLFTRSFNKQYFKWAHYYDEEIRIVAQLLQSWNVHDLVDKDVLIKKNCVKKSIPSLFDTIKCRDAERVAELEYQCKKMW